MKTHEAQEEQQRVEQGREVIVLWASLFRTIRLYDRANDTTLAQCKRICEASLAILEVDGEVELTVRHDSLFINGLRIRETSLGATSCHQMIDLLRTARVGAFSLQDEVEPSEVELFARLLRDMAEGRGSSSDVTRELGVRGVSHIRIQPAAEEEGLPEELSAEHIAKRVYLRSIDVVKGVFHELRSADRISARKVKRVVQGMIDSLESDPTALTNLTRLKNYDEYTFNHSVNVSVLAIALGRHVGLDRQQLYSIGQAGMLHDLGKLCIPKEILNKPGRLTPEERQIMEGHAVEGFISISRKLGMSGQTIDIALTAFEHHLNDDGTGYPKVAAKRPKGFHSQIVSIVDRYDAMTTDRIYRAALAPQKALAILFNSQGAHHDPALLKYFLNLVGYYPLGTTVRLSDGSLAIVVGGATRPELRHLPTVQIILDPEGKPAKGETADLARLADSVTALHIAESVNAADYGIEVMDYIL